MNTLKAEKRDMSIKAKKLRREGFVTGNLFGRELEASIPLKFDKAEISLKKAIANNPNDCYTYKELAYTYTKLINFKKVAETYSEMSKICTEQSFVQETAHNLAYEYFKIKDKTNFKKWKIEAEKWSKTENQYTKNLSQMETELNK